MRRYKFDLYPTPDQAALLHEHRKAMADLWNALKQRQEDNHRRTRGQRGVVHAEGKGFLTYFDLTNEITVLRQECPEWREIPVSTSRRVAKWLTDAYQAFFRRVNNTPGEPPGAPRWRSREWAKTIPLGTMGSTGWRLVQRTDNPLSWRLYYAGLRNRPGEHREFTSAVKESPWIHARGRIPGPSGEKRDWEGRNGDIIWRDGAWELSVCVEIEARRGPPGRDSLTIEFDLIDGFARVNGLVEIPPGLVEAQLLQDRIDELKSRRDQKTRPGGNREVFERGSAELDREIAKSWGRLARIRRNALHVWTARIVDRASDITIIAPPVRQNTKTARGDEAHWGAAVAVVAEVNRNTLSQAPATAIQMLKYKAEEAGVRCDVVTDVEPKIAVGGDLVTAGKQLRRARRQLRSIAA